MLQVCSSWKITTKTKISVEELWNELVDAQSCGGSWETHSRIKWFWPAAVRPDFRGIFSSGSVKTESSEGLQGRMAQKEGDANQKL